MRLGATEILTVELALGELVGLPLTDMWRYVGFQRFEFGEQKPHLNRKGKETTSADYALVARGFWRIVGPDGFELDSDHFGEPRTDQHALPFYESLGEEDPPRVEGVGVREDGEISVEMSRGYVLSVRPWDEEPPEDADWSAREIWRYMPPEEGPRGHLVLDGDGLGWSGERN